MNRERKFKFWNTIIHQMEYDLLESRASYQNPFTRSDMIPLESTGLKDRNGKVAYEGDKLKTSNGDISEVYWENECAGFCEKFENGIFIQALSIKVMAYREIVGNIYEGIKNFNQVET